MKKLFFFILFFVMHSVAFSAPSITSIVGKINDGHQIKISGKYFGSEGPNIILFDDFSRGVAGEVLSTNATVGMWDSLSSRCWEDSFLSNGKGARVIGPNGTIRGYILFGGEYAEFFVSSRAYVPSGYRFPNATGLETFNSEEFVNMKFHWVYYGNYGHGGGWGHDLWTPDIHGTSGTWRLISTNESKSKVLQTSGSPGWEWGVPVRWTTWIRGNARNDEGTDGFFQGLTSSQHISHIWNTDNMDGKYWFSDEYESEGMPYAFDRMSIPGYFRHPSYPPDNFVIDDVYVAVGPTARARVEIGNNATYASCTKLAICTINSWSTNQINAVVREGGFSANDSVYLFAIDSDGDISSGYGPLTFEGESTYLHPLGLSSTNIAPFSYFSVQDTGTPVTRQVQLDQTGSPATVDSDVLTVYLVSENAASGAKISASNADAGVEWLFSSDNVNWDTELVFGALGADSTTPVYIKVRVANDGSVSGNQQSAKIQISKKI